MADKHIIYDPKEHIGYITLNRPQSGNRIDPAMTRELAEICAHINGDKDIHLAVITGAGDAFCSGGEINPLNISVTEAEMASGIAVSEAIAAINQPTIAAINGDAIGEGLEIALSCDLRIASDKARFGLPQIIERRIPVNGGTQRLPRIVGKGKALEMVLTGEIIDARTAFEVGLVNKVIDHDNLPSEVETTAKNIAGKAPWALQYVKEAVNKGLDLTLEQGLRLEADLYFLLHTTSDRTEGITSFLQKRTPKYKGQ
jgi:enoyl-CoA hydratase